MANITGNASGTTEDETYAQNGLCESQEAIGVEVWDGRMPPDAPEAVRAVPALVRSSP
jgi:hypothetical protein